MGPLLWHDPVGAVEPLGSLLLKKMSLQPAKIKSASGRHLSVGFPLDLLCLVPLELPSIACRTPSLSGGGIDLPEYLFATRVGGQR